MILSIGCNKAELHIGAVGLSRVVAGAFEEFDGNAIINRRCRRFHVMVGLRRRRLNVPQRFCPAEHMTMKKRTFSASMK